jgi:hypothetical protein
LGATTLARAWPEVTAPHADGDGDGEFEVVSGGVKATVVVRS